LLFYKLNFFFNNYKNIYCCVGYYLDLISALSIKSFFLSFGLFNIIYIII
jgi:hypothetical protein